jgi:3D (Asp-Asp-Asp) domain-containing protein
VSIRRASPITIIADGVSLETRTRGDTVSDALADGGVALMGLDYAIPGEDARVVPGMSIRVIRVTEDVLLEQEHIPYETVFQPDDMLELDQRRLAQAGQNGITRTHIRVRYEDGVEVSRESETTTVVQEATDEIVAYGTMIVLRTVGTPDGPREYWRRIRMYATSYHPVNGDNITGTGEILRKGIVAVVPGTIPYFTEVYVPGYGIGLVADSGGGLPNSDLWIDLGYTEDDYVSWHEYVDVYLLTPVPERINYILPD